MAGRKRKPCEFCEQEQIIQTDYDARNVSAQVEIYPDNCLLAFVVQGKSDDGELTHEQSFDIEMAFCPVCGRNLRGW